jgi:hypothetical protein
MGSVTRFRHLTKLPPGRLVSHGGPNIQAEGRAPGCTRVDGGRRLYVCSGAA